MRILGFFPGFYQKFVTSSSKFRTLLGSNPSGRAILIKHAIKKRTFVSEKPLLERLSQPVAVSD